MSNNWQPPYVNPYPHLHANGVPPYHVDMVMPNGGHHPIDVKNPLGALAIRGAAFGPPK